MTPRQYLFAAVAVTLVSYTLQAPMTLPALADSVQGGEALRNMLMQYMMQQMMQQQQQQQGRPQPEQYGGAQPEQFSPEMMKNMIEHYIKGLRADNMQEGGDGGDNMIRMMLTHYLESQKDKMGGEMQQQGEGQDWLTKAMVEHYVSNKEGGGDALKSIIYMLTKQSMQEPSDKQKMMMSLLRHAMANPEVRKDTLVQKLLAHAISQQDGEDHGLLAVLFTHMLSKQQGEESELVKMLLHKTLTQDTFKEGHGKQILLLLIQHYIAKEGGSDKDNIGLMLLHTLSMRKDPESGALLRKLVYHMITSGDKKKQPMDQPAEYHWKWLPPKPCRMENNDNQVVYQEPCPMNLQCSVGPYSTTVNNTQRRVTLCAMPSQYLLYHACQVSYVDGTVIKYQDCPSNYGQCSLGPFRVQVNDTDGRATFCTGLVQNLGRPTSIVDRACRVQDRYHYYPLQRRCPYGFSCEAGPFKANWTDGEPVHAYVCHPEDDDKEDEHSDFMSKMLYLMLGVTDDMAGKDGGNSSMSQGVGGDEFLKFMLQHLMEQGKKAMENKDKPNPMHDRDHVGLLILKHFVKKLQEEQDGGGKIVEKVLKHMVSKYQSSGLEEGDRKMMNMLIMHFVHKKKEAEEEKEEKEKEEKEKAMMKMMLKHMMEHAKQSESGPNMDMLKMMLEHAHKMKEEEGDDKDKKDMLTMLVKHVLSQGEQQQSQSGGYKQLVMMLLQHMMKQKEQAQSMEEKQKAFMMEMLKHVMSQKEEATQDGQHMEALMKFLHHMMQERAKEQGRDWLQTLYEKMKEQKEQEKEQESEGEWKKKMMMKFLHHALEEKLGMGGERDREGQGSMGGGDAGELAQLMMFLKHAESHQKIESHLGQIKEKLAERRDEMGGDEQAKAFWGLLKMLMKE